eukprot:9799186-Ditylum_brightwellii.AAC.1
MHMIYSPIKKELAKLLLRFFPDILSKEVLLKGYGLHLLGTSALSGMCMEKKGLPYLQRALRVNVYKNDGSKYWKKEAEEGGAPNHQNSCSYPNKN